MIMGGAVTTDAVLAQQYDARVKEIIGQINKMQETIVAGRPHPEKAAIDKVVAEARKLVLASHRQDLGAQGRGRPGGNPALCRRAAHPPGGRATSRRRTNLSPAGTRREQVREEAMAQRAG
jgi:hypothetical protein